jgi:hypothetical protein
MPSTISSTDDKVDFGVFQRFGGAHTHAPHFNSPSHTRPNERTMRLIKQNIERDGSGTITLFPEEPEDMVSSVPVPILKILQAEHRAYSGMPTI